MNTTSLPLNKNFKFWGFLIVVLIVLVSIFVVQLIKVTPRFHTQVPVHSDKITEEWQKQSFYVKRIVDGDTIEVVDGNNIFKVRYIGIDTPETVKPNAPVDCFGKEASNYNKQLVEKKNVYLEPDVQSKDSFGRELRYVYVKNAQNEFDMVNKILVAEGYAFVATYPPNVKYQSEFMSLESEARNAQRGLWITCSNTK